MSVNPQSEIDNPQSKRTHPQPRGGTDLTVRDRRPVRAHSSKQSGSYNTVRRLDEFVVLKELFCVNVAEENQAYFLEHSVLLKKHSDGS